MSENILDNILVVRSQKSSRNEVLRELAEAVIKAGFAKEGFYEALLDRENNFPTGLHTDQIEIAIPHADAEWTVKPSVTIGILENPVKFEPMGGTGGEVNAKLVFLLTINDPKEHINFLRVFTNMITETNFLIDLWKNGDPTMVINLLRAEMSNKAEQIRLS